MNKQLVVRKGSKGMYELDYFEGRKDKSVYHNLLNPNAAQIAAILIDLELTTSLPIFEAVKMYFDKRKNGDWLGI